MDTQSDFLRAVEQGWLRLAEEIGPEHLDPLLALWLAQYIRGVAAVGYALGAADAQKPKSPYLSEAVM